MRSKTLVGILGAAVGLAAAVAEQQWSGQAIHVQITLYSVFVLLPLLLGLWKHRHQPRFWSGILLLFASHALFLFLIRSICPFRSILTIIPLILMEATIAFILMLKMDWEQG